VKTDKAWERWGANEPYFAVLTDDRYLADNIDDSRRTDFFHSGAVLVEGIIATYTRLRGDAARFGSVLDFGCGVGRLTIPLAERFESATGVDVSQSMLDESCRNCERAATENVQLMLTADFVNAQASEFDLVVSFLVFQHMRKRRGEALLAELLSRLAPGGMAVLQLMFAQRYSDRVHAALRRRVHLLRKVWYLLRGEILVAPLEMNPYDMNRVLTIFQDQGLSAIEVSLDRMGDIRSATIVGIKGEAT